MRPVISARVRTTAVSGTAMLVLAGLNAPAAIGYAQRTYHAYAIERPAYKASRGHWDLLDVPGKYRVNAIHAALLHTGKVLLIAGSGNNEQNFDAGSFRTLLWDPERNTFESVPTPKDLFCSGHAQLPGGQLLLAGGTARYEILQDRVERAAGPMLVKNEDPDHPRHLPRGTLFRAPDGTAYRTVRAVDVPAAAKRTVRGVGGGKRVEVTAAESRTFVEAVEKGPGQVRSRPAQYRVDGLSGSAAHDVYGLAGAMTMDKQDYQGIKAAYEFEPVSVRYVPVDPMTEARWYPTLVTLEDGRVLAVSGLDDVGRIIDGENEIYDPRTRTWSAGPHRYFPTYPALFLTKGGKLFYTGSNAGYGPAHRGRTPGVWDLGSNSFRAVPGLKDPDLLETSASVLLPPAQDQKVMVLGGGGVGESDRSTPRTAVVDLDATGPTHFTDGPDLPQGTRYLSSVILPDDTVFTSGGSKGYRGKSASDIHKAQFYSPETNTFRPAADPVVGRDYHSTALLLPDGRVATFGSDPLYADPDNTRPGTFEQRVEIYTPPYLYRSSRPAIGEGPTTLRRGAQATFRVRSGLRIATARLMRPSAVTHTTDVEQRSVALGLRRGDGSVTLTVPEDPALAPRGWYMLFVTDSRGTPSRARWVHVP